MQTKRHDNLIAVRLFSGEDIYVSLAEACRKYSVETAVILSGLGQLKDFTLGYFKQKGDYCPQQFASAHELVSLTGTISLQEGEYAFHLHATLTDEKKQAFGGHLIGGTVQVTNEIVLMASEIKITRRVDENTGLKGLFLEGEDFNAGDAVKWYFSTKVIVVALLCVGPLALPLIWLHPKYKPLTKIVLTVIVTAVTVWCWYYTKGLYDQLHKQLSGLT